MKRIGNLWPQVLERENLVRAFHQAARGKRQKMEVRRFAENLDENLEQLRFEIAEHRFEIGHYHVFEVYDPKQRTIHAARFPERVFHHALMNLCEPVLERQAVHHSYACRKGKGRMKAIEAAQKAARAGAWHLKLDIRKYFESIPVERLIGRLHRVFKDPEVLFWFEKILRGHRPEEGRGLPIGSLTSQHLANFYLGTLDRFCAALPGVTAYCRYMDDFVCWGVEKKDLLAVGRAIQAMVEDELGLALKHPPCPQRSARGMDYLGYRIFPSHLELNRRSKVRYWRRLRVIQKLEDQGDITQTGAQQRLTALTAFVLPVRCWAFRRGVMEKFRSVAIGLEPDDPGRQLEQQREQLPRSEPQQQQPGQHEQQHRLPHSPQLRPNGREIPAMSMGLNRPPSCSPPPCGGDKTKKCPPGVSRRLDVFPKALGGRISLIAACFALLLPATSHAVVVAIPEMNAARMLGMSYGGVGTLEIQESSGNYRGSGVLLNDRWVLTAAHNWQANAVTSLAFSIGGQRYAAAEWQQHPAWNGTFSTTQGWDVGLVRLAEPVAGYGTTPRYYGNAELGKSITVLGTGMSGSAGQILNLNTAGTVYGFTNTIDRVIVLNGMDGAGGLLLYDFDNGSMARNSLAMAAAYNALGQPVSGQAGILASGSADSMTALEGTSAAGDSGGPAFADFGNGPELVGIISWGVNPAEPGNLYGSGYGDVGYLMRVSTLNNWIDSVIPEPRTPTLMMLGFLFLLMRKNRARFD